MKKVFILGAGASLPYGLPVGTELRNLIIKVANEFSITESSTSPDYDVRNFKEIFKFFPGDNKNEILEAFGRNFESTDIDSVDKFLNLEDYRDRYEKIGKFLIAFLILKKENKKSIYKGLNKFENQNWMSYLWNNEIFDHDLSNIISKQITFITFNYDRSLEYYFQSVISKAFPNEKININDIFNIIHVYGQVGNIGIMEDGKEIIDDTSISYGEWNLIEKFNKNINGLRLIYETRKNQDLTDHIRVILHEADRIFFTGFGFDQINMKTIGFDGFSKKDGVGIYGNAYGMKKGEKDKIIKHDNFNELPDDLNNLDFLRTYLGSSLE